MIISNNFSSMNQEGVVVYRQSPNRRVISYYRNRYFLSFPYIFYSIKYMRLMKEDKFKYNGLTISFSATLELNKLFFPALYNCNAQQQCCLDEVESKFDSVEILCKQVIHQFWSSEFNFDLTGSYSRYFEKHMLLSDYNKWSEKTRSDPAWIPNESELVPSLYINMNSFVGISFREKT